MPYSNFGVYQGAAENAALNKRGRNRLAKDLYEYQLTQNIQDRSFIESRDPNVFAPKSHNKVVPLPTRGGPAKYAARNPQDPMIRDWNTIKETAGFVKDNPKEAMELSYLSMMQSPIKLIGRLGEATWARGNDNYQNELSNKALNNILTQDAQAYRKEHTRTNGSYEDMMNRVRDFQEKQGMTESIRPEFTSDTTLGDVADVASWLIPGPGTAVKSGIKGAQVTGKIGKLVGTFAKEYPRAATAGAATVGAGTIGAYELSKPDEAKAVTVPDFIKLLTKGIEAEASRPGRNLATTVADRMFGTMRNRGGAGRIPVSEMEVRPDKNYVMQLVEDSRNWFTKNQNALDIYPEGRQAGYAVSASHPPGMDPALASKTMPDHFSSGKLNEIESKINAERRRAGLEPYTRYRDIISAAIEKANRGEFGKGTFAESLKGKSLKEAQKILGAEDIKYW